MSKIKNEVDSLNIKQNQLKEEISKLAQSKMDVTATLDRLKELENYIAKLEGIISGYAVAFNSTLSQYKSFINEEIQKSATNSLTNVAVNQVINNAILELGNLFSQYFHEHLKDNEPLKISLDQVVEGLKIDLQKIQQEQFQKTIEIAPLSANEYLHITFSKLKSCVEAGVIPMLVGPAGTGKSTAVEQLARSLNLRFYTANRVQNAFELTGYNDAAGKYVGTQFYEAYKNGGVFFFDEVDASAPEALVTINTAIAQGYMSFPGFTYPINMHKNFKVVAAGNTYGNGASREYCGRNALDAATLDRFMVIEWDYDQTLEKKIIEDNYLLNFCWGLREVIASSRIHIIISTRGILATLKILKVGGFSVAEALRGNLFEGLNKDTVIKLIGGLDNLDKTNASRVQAFQLYANNPYYLATKNLINYLK
ncbi:MAG: AAA family ATPase [Acholeplasmatales bacterium]|jgi:DNA polymerase III delta prime subunit|nr:AAA family ATPase [Acholeplasmatales bacterium]